MSQKSKNSTIAQKAWQLAEPYARQLDLSIWDVRFLKEGASWYLRYFIDKPDGVGIEDCEKLSKAVDGLLDDAGFIEQAYYLEVSSPGLGRRLTRPEHFALMKGRDVVVRTTRPVDGKHDFTGLLSGDETTDIVIESGGAKLNIPKTDVSFVKLNDLPDIDLED